jgi:O-antigen/teichoic acid export membrane protein
MIRPGFLKSTTLYTVGGGLPVLAGIILLPFYANYLSALSFVQLSFYISISLFVQIFFSFSLDAYFGIRYAQLKTSGSSLLPYFISQTGAWTWLLGLFWTLVFLISGPVVFPHIFNPSFQMVFGKWAVLSILTGFFNAGIRNVLQVLMYEQKPLTHFFLNVLNFILTTGLGIAGIFVFPDSPEGPVYARCLSAGIVFLAAQPFLFPVRKKIPLMEGWKDALQFCLPYFFFTLGSWGLLQADRYLIQHSLKETELNAYDLLQKCFFGMEFFHNTLSAVLFPVIFLIWSKMNPIQTTQETNRYFHVFTALNILILPLFNGMLPLLYGVFIRQNYFYDALDYTGLVSCWYVFRPLINYYLAAFLFSRKMYELMMVFMICAVLQLTGVAVFTPVFGLKGAIFAGFFVRILQAILMHIMLYKKRIFFRFNPWKMIGLPLLFVVFALVHFYFISGWKILPWIVWEVVLIIAVYFLYNREILITLNRYKEIIAERYLSQK